MIKVSSGLLLFLENPARFALFAAWQTDSFLTDALLTTFVLQSVAEVSVCPLTVYPPLRHPTFQRSPQDIKGLNRCDVLVALLMCLLVKPDV